MRALVLAALLVALVDVDGLTSTFSAGRVGLVKAWMQRPHPPKRMETRRQVFERFSGEAVQALSRPRPPLAENHVLFSTFPIQSFLNANAANLSLSLSFSSTPPALKDF